MLRQALKFYKRDIEPPLLLGLNLQWSRAVVEWRPERGPCPACGGRDLDNRTICLVCSRSRHRPQQHPVRDSSRHRVVKA
jgi:hypothetical protein